MTNLESKSLSHLLHKSKVESSRKMSIFNTRHANKTSVSKHVFRSIYGKRTNQMLRQVMILSGLFSPGRKTEETMDPSNKVRTVA